MSRMCREGHSAGFRTGGEATELDAALHGSLPRHVAQPPTACLPRPRMPPPARLDSEMAVSLTDTLVRLARQNRTVVLTIHQPNSMITSKFDEFLLLHAGRTVFNVS